MARQKIPDLSGYSIAQLQQIINISQNLIDIKKKKPKRKTKKSLGTSFENISKSNENFGEEILKQVSAKPAKQKALKGKRRYRKKSELSDSDLAIRNLIRWNLLLKLTDKTKADMLRRSLENFGITFTKSGNVSKKSLKNEKANEFFIKDKANIDSMIKKRRSELKAEQEEKSKIKNYFEEAGYNEGDIEDIIEDLKNRGELWYHDKDKDIIETEKIFIKNLKNPKFTDAIGINTIKDENGKIKIQKETLQKSDGYNISDIIKKKWKNFYIQVL